MLKSGIKKPLWRSFIFGSCILQDKTVGETMGKAVFRQLELEVVKKVMVEQLPSQVVP